MSYLNPLNIQKPQDIHLSDEERHTQFKNAGLEENYSSMTGLIYNGNNVRTEVAGKVNIKELYNEIDGQIHQLEGYNQDGVNDVLDEYDEEYQDTISNISDKGAYDPTVAYHFGNVVDYSTLNSKITPKYTNQQTTTTGKNLFNVADSSFQWGTLYFKLINNIINISIGDGNGGIGQNSQGDYTDYNFNTSKDYYFSVYPKNGQLTFKEDAVSKWFKVCLYIKYSDDTTSDNSVFIRPNMTEIQSTKLTFTDGKTPVAFAIGRYSPGSTLNNNQTAEYYVQLEENAATSYEPYTGGLPSPSPEYQQPITAIKAVNLFDKDNANINKGYIHSTDNKIYNANNRKYLYISVTQNMYYTITKISGAYFRAGISTDLPQTNVDLTNVIIDDTGNKITINSGNGNYLVVSYFKSDADTLTEEEILNTIQIEEGDTPHTYAPYGKIPIRCYTNNLAVNSEYTLTYDRPDSTAWGAISNDFMKVEYGKTYTLSFYYNNVLTYWDAGNGYGYVYAYDSNKERIGTDYMQSRPGKDTKTIEDPNIVYIKVLCGAKGYKGDNFKIQLEEGSVRTEYKPYYNKYFYLDLQGNELSKIIAGTGGSPKTIEDDITIDENNDIIFNKNVGKCVLVGTENVSYDSSMDRFTINIDDSLTETVRNMILSDRFLFLSSGHRDGYGFIYGGKVFLYNRSCTSSEEMKTWLSTHNTTIYYEPQTPETISLGTLPADFLPHMGNVNIEVCTNLEATNKYNIGTNSYLTLQDTTAGTLPTNTTYFKNIGLTGDIGDSSMGTVTCGVWDSTTTYNEKDLVAYGTDLYVAKQANTNQTPSSASQYWELIIQYDKPLVALSNYAPDNIIKGSLWFDII